MPESSSDSVSRFKLKRTLETLASKEGRGTELISLYVPPDRKIHEVMGNLRDEYGTATNIKSRTTRKNVQEAIERTLQRLKLFKRPPKNGLVIFCGAIPRDGLKRCRCRDGQRSENGCPSRVQLGHSGQTSSWWPIC